jgi:hypothetical protein
MLRVFLGRARPETEWSGKISGLEFDSDPGGGAGAQAPADSRSRSHGTSSGFVINTIVTVPRSHLEHEVDIEAGDGTSDEGSARGKDN